ncbi:MAG: zinc ABC transporter substrate-binding protein [Pseudodesulfovibrio sp.]
MALFLFLLIAGKAAAADKVSVFVSIVPEQYFLEKIGGDRVDVSVMVMPGASPATYEPSPRQMAGLTKARAYFAMDVPFEATWLDRIRSANPDMAVVRVDEGIRKMPMARHSHGHDGPPPDHDGGMPGHGPEPDHGSMPPDHGHAAAPGHGPEPDHDHEHGVLDPHIWLSPRLVKVMAVNICQGLSAVDPAGKTRYEANLAAFERELDDLDRRIGAELALLPGDKRAFMVFHPSWGYFAHDYGLQQVPIESEGKEPSPGDLARIVTLGKERRIPVVFVQPQFSERSAKVIASEMGARVVPLDPLAADWQANLLRVAGAFKQALE